ncbi:MAG: type II toxin-antitoxin system VapC family toxin [Candidatus Micrarchaeota archaeon]
MEKICLDFEIAIDFLRGDPATIEKLRYYADREEICITSITMMHLMETVSKSEVVSAFAGTVTVLPFDKKAAQVASKIINEFKDKGEARRADDGILTAAICMANDAFIYSRSPAKFDGIKGLRRV